MSSMLFLMRELIPNFISSPRFYVKYMLTFFKVRIKLYQVFACDVYDTLFPLLPD